MSLFPELDEAEAPKGDLFPELSGGAGDSLFPEIEEKKTSPIKAAAQAIKGGVDSILGKLAKPITALTDKLPKKEAGPLDDIIKDIGLKQGIKLSREMLEKQIGPTAARGVLDVASGAVSTVSGFGGVARMAGLESFGESISRVSDKIVKEMAPPDPNLADQIAQGFGSMAVFMVPGFGVQAGSARLALFAPRIASWMGVSTAAVLEASVEAGSTYNESLKRNPDDKEAAAQAGNKVFWSNLPILLATDKLGIFGESGTALRKAFASSLLEGSQEASQEMISNFALKDPVMKDTLNAFIVGAAVGGTVGAGVGLAESAKKPVPAPAKEILGDSATQTLPVPEGAKTTQVPQAPIIEPAKAVEAPPAPVSAVQAPVIAAPAPVARATPAAPTQEAVQPQEAQEKRPFELPGTEIGSKETFDEIQGMRAEGALDEGQEAFAAKLEQFWRDNPNAKTGIVRQDGSIQPVFGPEPDETEPVDTPSEVATAQKMEAVGPRNISSMTQAEFQSRFPNAPLEAHRGAVRARLMANKDIPDAVAQEYSDVLDEVQKEQQETPKGSKTPILDEIRKQGGIDLTAVKKGGHMGELENVKRLNVLRKKGGRTIDQLAESLAAAGVIPENSPNALFDALDKEARGAVEGGLSIAEETTGYGEEPSASRESSRNQALPEDEKAAREILRGEGPFRRAYPYTTSIDGKPYTVKTHGDDFALHEALEHGGNPSDQAFRKERAMVYHDEGHKLLAAVIKGKREGQDVSATETALKEVLFKHLVLLHGQAPQESMPDWVVRDEETSYQMVPTFYSKLQKDIAAKLPEKATVGQVQAILRETKEEERKWSGIDDFLKGKDKVSKPELLEFLRANQLEIKEIEKVDKPNLPGMGWDQREMEAIRSGTQTKYSDYQLPGGQNYRELLLTLPSKPSVSFEEFAKQYRTRFPDTRADEEMIRDYWRQGHTVPAPGRSSSKTDANVFKSSHFAEPNILAHVRFNDRYTGDGYTPPNKALFIEEIQSDWHQKGRREGYASDIKALGPEDIDVKYAGTDGNRFWRVETKKDGTFITNVLPHDIPTDPNGQKATEELVKQEALNRLQNQPHRTGLGVAKVPDAPLKKTWHEFALKRMVRYAAENGYDSIAWTTGEQQAERYDLSKQVDAIMYNTTKDGEFSVWADGKDGRRVEIGTHPAARLPDVVGKDIADKIIAGQGEEEIGGSAVFKTLSGLDLKVGGEGMKGFYDKIVPAFLNKFGKKFGAQVGQAKIKSGFQQEGDQKDPVIDTKKPGYAKVHSFPITPQLKNAALHEGFALFDKMQDDYLSRKSGQSSQAGRDISASGGGKASSAPSSKVSSSSDDSITGEAQKVKEQLEFNFEQKQSLEAASKDIEKAGKQAAPKFNPKQIDRELKKRGFIDFRGQRVENPRQAAEIAAAFRHPKLEHFQAIFLKNKVVVAHQVMTSRLPDAAIIHIDVKNRILDAAKRLGADQIYFAHNHPSGEATPSPEDLKTTRELARELGDIVVGQVVTNGKHFSFINRNGRHYQQEYTSKVDYRPIKARTADPFESVALASKEFSGHKGYGLIFTDPRRNVIAIEHLKPTGNLREFVKNRRNYYGAHGVILAGDSSLLEKVNVKIPGLYEVISFGDGTSSWAMMRQARLRSISEKAPFVAKAEKQLEKGQLGSYRVQEDAVKYGPDEFDALVITNRIKPGQEFTLRQAIIDPGVEGGRIPRGRKVKIVDMDRDGGQFLVEYRPEGVLEGMGSFTTATPQDFVETYRQSDKPAPKSSVGKRVKEVTGVKKESPQVSMNEAQALKMKLGAMEKASKIGEREGVRKTRITLIEKFKSKIEDMSNARWLVVHYLKQNLPVGERGKFLRMATNAKTQKDLARALIRIDHEVTDLYRKSLVSDIRTMAERALDSAGVAVEYKRRIRDLLSGVELKSHSQRSLDKLRAIKDFIAKEAAAGRQVELPERILNRLSILARRPLSQVSEHELEWMFEDLQAMVALGKTQQRVREELYQLRKERILREVLPASFPIEKTIKVDALPGDKLSFRQKFGNFLAKSTDFAQDIDLAITPIDVAFDILDGVKSYTGPNYVNFKKRLDVAFGKYLDLRDELVKPVREMVVKLGLNESNFERIGVYAIRIQKNGPEHLMGRGLSKAQIDSVQLSPNEMKVYQEMRRIMESQFPAVQKTIASLYNRDIGKVENYFSFHTDYDSLSDVDIVRRFGDSDIRARLTKTEEQGYTKSRAEGARQAIKINAMDIFEKHIDDVAYLIETQSDVKMLFEVANSGEYGQAVGQVGQRFVLEWMDLMARKGGADGAKRIRRLDILRRNYGAAVLGLRISSILVQPTSLLDASALIGGRYVAAGLVDISTSKQWRDFLLKNFPELRNRIGDDAAFSDLSQGAFMKKFQRIGFAGLQWMDSMSASAAVAGAYRKAMDQMGLPVDLNSPNAAAIEAATLLLRRTQASPLFKDLSLATSRGGLTGNRSLDKALTQFHTFMLNRWSLIEHDLYRIGIKQGKTSDAAWIAAYLSAAVLSETGIRRGAKYAIGSVLAGLGLSALPPDDKDPFMKDFMVQALDVVPFVSDFVHMAFYESSPIPLLTPIVDLPKSVYRASKARTDEAAIKATVKAIEALAGMTGIPGVSQAGQFIREYFNGRKLYFPYAEELNDLRAMSKRGKLTDDEGRRLNKLKNLQSKHKIFNDKFKRAMEMGNMDRAREAAEGAKKAMENQ